MKSMTVQERIDDIVKRSGFSEEIVRRVLNAERESILESLKHGERATLIGRCTIVPELRKSLDIGGKIKTVIKLKASPSYSLESELVGLEGFIKRDTGDDDNDEGIMLRQLPGLV